MGGYSINKHYDMAEGSFCGPSLGCLQLGNSDSTPILDFNLDAIEHSY